MRVEGLEGSSSGSGKVDEAPNVKIYPLKQNSHMLLLGFWMVQSI